ncbi:hypothetical protein CCR94_19695 [Rhodoblastus sphagnicola]|uniref:Uncharacterized protein n=1 Tax=Rhodoblastus sphagnicola TaxID=333368 RepID=A0A2S6MZ12_9HYPH|nr:hypothetical protein [Rhodoblastus sphagnicola]MBB4200621.1 hypothetical protein [Rhodoblastus sphagnicola]PPQ27592.1 hypothetical protein CCR94_19695 [Rhodoblastus sphagnicola]
MKILHIAFVALTVAAPLSSANAAQSHRRVTADERAFVANSEAMNAASERSARSGYAAGEDSSTSVNWRKIGGF